MNALSIFKRDLLIAFRNRGELLNPLMFFLIDKGLSLDSEYIALDTQGEMS